MILLAHYGFNLDTISRLQGNSATQALAYILRGKFYDEYKGKTFDYSHMKDFLHSEVILPENAPPEYLNPVTLCNRMERAEKRYDGRTGRVIWLSLPNELELDDWLELVREFAYEAFVCLGMCVIIAIHYDRHPNDPAKDNPNAHFILSDRPLTREGFCIKKDRDWNKKAHIRIWRRQWADIQNKMFERKGRDVRVSHLSLEVQGIDREPTIPLGRTAMALENRGIQTELGNRNRAIIKRNLEREVHNRPRERERSRERAR